MSRRSGVGAPAHAELELLHDAGDDAHGEVDEEELPVELRELQVAVITRADPGGLEAGHDEAQADRDGDEEEVVDVVIPNCHRSTVERSTGHQLQPRRNGGLHRRVH